MKRFILSFLFVVFAGHTVTAQDITTEEREKAVTYLEKTRAAILAATRGLSDAQWNFKPAADRWSVAEIVEHIASAEDFLMEMIQDKVMKAPPRAQAEDVKAVDELVLARVPDRSNKAQAPEPLRPANRFGSPQESLKHFEESRAKTIQFLKDTKDLRGHATESFIGKDLDGYQWLLFLGAHSERHTKQLNEVKADRGFPKN